ncbi:MAG: type II toxin-antitoxin system RelE/ParE family toxin [Candidatus Margulisbacteria bacterium]|jgi:plasmid stabilization system protein ParE|nr:type II toxin-antitoxin system RelE/ParE family toxin [Candidatus Margulisiibacteriota bacterium]
MPLNKPKILPTAHNDIQQIVDYLLANNKQAAAAFSQALDRAREQLVLFPESAPISTDVRLAGEKYRALVLVYDYLLFYKIHKQTVVVYRVLNGKRNYREFV